MYTPALCPHLVLDVNQIPFTHTAKQLPCPQSVLCLGFTRGAGFPSTPIQSCLVSLSPSCQLLPISGELASAPQCPAPAPGSVPSCTGQADHGCLCIHVTGKRVPGSQLSPGAGGACYSTSYTLTHVPYTTACIYCTPTMCPALKQTDTPCLHPA